MFTAKKELVETIKHVSLRTHCFLCIILGCSTRLLLTHRDLLRQLLNDNGEISILDLLHEWIVVNVSTAHEYHFYFLFQVEGDLNFSFH